MNNVQLNNAIIEATTLTLYPQQSCEQFMGQSHKDPIALNWEEMGTVRFRNIYILVGYIHKDKTQHEA